MPRLIDADALKDNAFSVQTQDYGLIDAVGIDAIDEAPTIDPVKHGMWVYDDDGYARCGECNQKAPVFLQYQDEPETHLTRHCPSCGCKMEGDGDV